MQRPVRRFRTITGLWSAEQLVAGIYGTVTATRRIFFFFFFFFVQVVPAALALVFVLLAA